MLLRSLIAAFAVLVASASWAEPQTKAEYIKVFQSGYQLEKQKAMESLEWAGLSSADVFDSLEAEVLAKFPSATDRASIDYASWLVKSLAFSGNPKYLPTIEKVAAGAPHKKLKKYALQAQAILPKYTKLNAIIAPAGQAYPSLDQRLSNMLKSSEVDLNRLAAKRIYYTSHYTPELLTLAKTNLENGYKNKLDGDQCDSLAWQARVLAGSHKEEYREFLQQVANSAQEKKLRKYTAKYLKG